MASPRQQRTWIFDISRRATTAALALAIVFMLRVVATQSTQAQTFTVIHAFTGGLDKGKPVGLTIDRTENLFGTTEILGGDGHGAVFERSYPQCRTPQLLCGLLWDQQMSPIVPKGLTLSPSARAAYAKCFVS